MLVIVARLDPQSPEPLYRQLYRSLRQDILDGRLPAGTRLPPTRLLCAQLELSRNTVIGAIDQLQQEGFVRCRVGAGTFVTEAGPPRLPVEAARLSDWGETCLKAAANSRANPFHADAFCPALPGVDDFPFDQWTRILGRVARHHGGLVGYSHANGLAGLRQAVAAYLRTARGVACTEEQVFITTGAQAGLSGAARLLLDPGEPAWLEEPHYLGARGALLAAGARLVPVPVDEEGLDVAAGARRQPSPRLIYVSPSHQFPLGVPMSLARRTALLELAGRVRAWVLEDDYDSEFRYTGKPLASLQGLDHNGRVLYVGTFSKIMFPALRLGYVVVPATLVDVFAAERQVACKQLPLLEQAALAAFIQEGLLARHLRKMRQLYDERRGALVEALGATSLRAGPCDTGISLVGWLPDGCDDRAVSAACERAGLEANPVSAYRLEPGPPGLLLGFGVAPEPALRAGVRKLQEVLCAF